MKFWLLLVLAALFNAFGNILLKNASVFSLATKSFVIYLMAGTLFFGLNLIFYAVALRDIKLNIAYPILVGIGLIIICIYSVIIDSRSLSIKELLGAAVILFGVYLLSSN